MDSGPRGGDAASFAGPDGTLWTARTDEAAWVRSVLAADPAAPAAVPGAVKVKENPVRTVWRVPRDGAPAIYVKRFRVSGVKDALKHLVLPSRARAEWDASLGLNAAGVPAVEVVAYGERRAAGLLRGAVCAVLEFPGAMELVPWMFARFGQEGPWTTSQREEREELLRRLGALLRRLHDAGFVHPDLHGGNLLLSREGSPPDLRLVDLHTVRRPGSAGTAARRRDLSVLLHSMRTATGPSERALVVEAYGGAAGGAGAIDAAALRDLARDLEEVIVSMERRRVASRTRPEKLFRPTGRFDTGRRDGVDLVFLRAWGAEPFVAALREHARKSADPAAPGVLKRGGRSIVTQVEVQGPAGPARLVVKETRVRGAVDLWKNAFRPPRAVAAWVAGNGLYHRMVDLAEPRALAVRGAWPLRRESFLVMEDASAGGERYDLRSMRLWDAGPLERGAGREKRAEIERFGRWLGDLHAQGIYHGDLKCVNVFVRKKHGRLSFCVVDYDRVSFGGGAVDARRRVKNLAQLAASVGKWISRADRLRFLRAWAKPIRGAWEARKRTAAAVAAACARKIVVVHRPIE